MFRTMLAPLVIVAAAMVACGGESEPEPTPEPTATAEPTPTTVSGTLTLWQLYGRSQEGRTCSGRRGYSDIDGGMEVRLLIDGDMAELSRLESGIVMQVEDEYVCVFGFQMAVPPGGDFYTVEIGRRGEFTYRWEEITSGELSYTIGN